MNDKKQKKRYLDFKILFNQKEIGRTFIIIYFFWLKKCFYFFPTYLHSYYFTKSLFLLKPTGRQSVQFFYFLELATLLVTLKVSSGQNCMNYLLGAIFCISRDERFCISILQFEMFKNVTL